jgi:hypothetical protein
MMRVSRSAIALLLVGTATRLAFAQDIKAMQITVDAERKAKSEWEALAECTKNPVCKTVVDAAFASAGIDSSTTTTAISQISQKAQGENTNYTFAMPAGYQYCRSTVAFKSVIPATGNRASYANFWVQDNAVRVYTWTPRRHAGQGKSHILAELTVLAVKNDAGDAARAAGKCKKNDTHSIVVCRGARGVNKGKPACTTATD